MGLAALAMLGLSFPALGGGAMTSHGPLNGFGYPTYYTDANGISVSQQTDFNNPLLITAPEVLLDRTTPLDVRSGNFYDESFYFLADSIMTPGGRAGRKALLVMAVEGMFVGPLGEVIEGDQGVMARLRVRVDLRNRPENVGIYTVFTPYENFIVQVTQADLVKNHARAAINFTFDSIFVMGPGERFTTPLDPNRANIGPTLLQWDTGAPVGYLGDPGVEHTVTGSPIGQNFFRVEGPNVGGPGIDFIQTDLFLVSGQIVPPDQLFVDANGNEITDSLDIASGFSRDCNANGIPDETEVFTKIDSVSPQTASFGAGFPQSVSLPVGTPPAISDVVVNITASGDFAAITEGATLDLNGVFVADVLFNTGHDCTTTIPDLAHVVINAVNYNTIVGAGAAVFTLTPSIDSNADYCGPGLSYANINVQFNGTSPLDLNQDGILDSCAGVPLMSPQPKPEIERQKRKGKGHGKS